MTSLARQENKYWKYRIVNVFNIQISKTTPIYQKKLTNSLLLKSILWPEARIHLPSEYPAVPSNHFQTIKICPSFNLFLNSPNKHLSLCTYFCQFCTRCCVSVLGIKIDCTHGHPKYRDYQTVHNWIHSLPLLTGKTPKTPMTAIRFCCVFLILNPSLHHNLSETLAWVISTHHLAQFCTPEPSHK